MSTSPNERDAISRSLAELTACVIDNQPMKNALHERLIPKDCRDMFAYDERWADKATSHIVESLRHSVHAMTIEFVILLIHLDDKGLIDKEASGYEKLLDFIEARIPRSDPPQP